MEMTVLPYSLFVGLSSLWCIASGQTLSLEYTVDTGNSFYENQSAALRCIGSELPPFAPYVISFGLSDSQSEGCVYTAFDENRQVWVSLTTSTLPADVMLSIGDDDCDSLPLASSSVTVSGTLTLTQNLEGLTFRCYYTYQQSGATSLPIDTVKVAPENIEISRNIDGEAVEGSPLTKQCSPGNSPKPPSLFQYELIRNGEKVMDLPADASYTPTPDDREGFQIKCIDSAHSDYGLKYPDAIAATSETIYPIFIARGENGEEMQERMLNPNYNNPLTCDIIGNPTPRYTWTSDKVDLAGMIGKTITLTGAQRENNLVENVTCTGDVTGAGKSLSITWTITWDDQSTTTTANVTPSPSKGGVNAGAVGGGIGAAAGVIVVVIVVAVVVKKRKASGKPCMADQASAEAGVQKSGRPPSRGQTPTKKKPPVNGNYDNKEIIYSEVQAISKPHPNTAMIRPTQREAEPPQDEVTYTSIDHLKTQAYKGGGGNHHEPAPTYDSVELGQAGGYVRPEPRARGNAPAPPSQPPPADSD